MLRKDFSRGVSIGGLGEQVSVASGGVPQELDGELSLGLGGDTEQSETREICLLFVSMEAVWKESMVVVGNGMMDALEQVLLLIINDGWFTSSITRGFLEDMIEEELELPDTNDSDKGLQWMSSDLFTGKLDVSVTFRDFFFRSFLFSTLRVPNSDLSLLILSAKFSFFCSVL